MLVSGVAAGIAAGIAFGGDWRRLASLTLRFWPLLVVAAALRVVGAIIPTSPLAVYLAALMCVALVAALNWHLPGAVLIAVGTLMNVAVIALNSGMPYDQSVAVESGISFPRDGLHVTVTPAT